MSASNIEWTDITWNPTTGCEKVSRGCKHCYAETMTKRLAAMGQEKYQGILTPTGRFNGKVRTHESELGKPFTWGKKPKMVFVNSMSDLFHEDVPFAFIDKVFAVMEATPQHTYQILTKRPDRMAEYFNSGRLQVKIMADYHRGGCLPNVWLGTSVENQSAADERIPHLLKCPAAVRFLSCEPLVGAVNFRWAKWVDWDVERAAKGSIFHMDGLNNIHWVIAGGESGHHATPMHPDWLRQLRDQCEAAGVAFFFKQWGEWSPDGGLFENVHFPEQRITAVHPEKGNIGYRSEDRNGAVESAIMLKVGKHAAGRLLDGRTHDGFPQSSIINNQSTIETP
jgi:protein gp37